MDSVWCKCRYLPSYFPSLVFLKWPRVRNKDIILHEEVDRFHVSMGYIKKALGLKKKIRQESHQEDQNS